MKNRLRLRRSSSSPRPRGPVGGISVCLITKNEAARLPRCLASVTAIAHEIIVVDTGSTDDTVGVASQFGARVLRTTWTDDFSAARNVALEAATGEWILSIDADEWLSPSGHRALVEAIGDKDVCAYKLALVNHLDGGREDRECITRLFRRDARVRFKGRIHEQVTEALVPLVKSGARWDELRSVVIEHDGYLRAVMNEKQKSERNQRLLSRAVEEHPSDPYLRYKLARELTGPVAHANLEHALSILLDRSIDELRSQPWAEQALINGALMLSSTDRPFLVDRVVSACRHAFGDHPALHLACARTYLNLGRARDALVEATSAATVRADAPDFDRAQLDLELSIAAADAERVLGAYGAAHQRLVDARRRQPQSGPLVHAMIELAIATHDYKGALRLAVSRLREHPSDIRALSLSATVAEKVGDHEAARRWRQSAPVSVHP